MTSQSHIAKWDAQTSWPYTLPPGRPSLFHIQQFYQSIVSRFPPSTRAGLHAAVLGSTPELRSLLFELGIEHITVIDHSALFYQRMSALPVTRSPSERFVNSDWVDALQRRPGHFDVIVSDLTSGNLPFNRRSVFYAAVARSLRNDGIFVDKLLTYPVRRLQIAALEHRFCHAPENLQSLSDFCNIAFFLVEYWPNHCIVCPDTIRSHLRERFASLPRLLWFVDHSRMLVPPKGRWFYGLRWSKERRLLSASLKIRQVTPEERCSPFFRYLKILVSSARSRSTVGGI